MAHPRPAAMLALAFGLVALAFQSTTAVAGATTAAPAKFSGLSRQLELEQQQSSRAHLRLRGDAGRPTHKEPPVWPEQFHAGTCRVVGVMRSNIGVVCSGLNVFG